MGVRFVVLTLLGYFLAVNSASAQTSTYHVWEWENFTVPNFVGQHANFANPELTIDVNYDTRGVTTVGNEVRFYVDPLNPNTGNGNNFRSEFRTKPWAIAHPLGTEQWIGWRYRIGDNYVPQPANGSPIIIWQNKQPDGGGSNSPALNLELTNEGQLNGVPASVIQIVNNPAGYREGHGSQVLAGDIVDIVIHVVYGLGNQGRFRVWINGVLEYDQSEQTVYDHYPNGSNNKWGIYAHQYRSNTGSAIELFMGTLKLLTRAPSDPNYGEDAYLLVSPEDSKPPAITAQPQDLTVTEGQPASFSVSATGTAPLSYQWQKNGNNIQGANAAAYNINSASLSDAGDYQVVVSNAAGSATSNSAALTVNPDIQPPAITAQPQDLTVTEGQPASFSVSATGTAPLSYQWQKDGNNIQGANAAAYNINSASLSDAGDYQVVVSNAAGSATSNSAALTVNPDIQPPAITAQPQDLTVTEGQPASFSVSATGTAPLSYQWQKNGSNIQGANAAAYNINSASLSDAGDYQVVVSNAAGSATSNGAALTVNPDIQPPAITAQPQDLTVTEGQPASFSVSATGTAPLSYQWQKNGSNIQGASAAAYNINSASLSDAGDYQVVVSNAAGSATSNSAALTVNPDIQPPAITAQPQDLTVTEGQPASFSVSATGTAPLSYQWQKNGNNIQGANAAAYNINSASLSDAGDYQVVVSNAAGSATSNSAALTVNPDIQPPAITAQPQDLTVTEGQPASFSVSATGTAPLSYQWQKNGSNIQGANAAAYNINSASLSDAGDYQVVVSNAAGSATSNSAALTVNPDIQPPAITAQPQDLTVTEGQPASFSVSATGTAPLSYQWQKNGSNIQGANAAAYNINSASLSDAGDYQVVVSNAAGSATSNSAALTVNPDIQPPAITAQPQDLTVTEGQPASFSVSATGTAPLSYQWQKNGNNIQGANAAAYNINSASLSDAGDYQVVVSNAAGSATSNSAALTVNPDIQPPAITAQPQDLTVTEGQPASFSVSATGTAPLSYQWQKNGSNIQGANAAAYNINSASLSDAGDYQVVVSNAAGSATSNSAALTVNPDIQPPAITAQPQDLTVTEGQPASFSVSATGTAPLSYQWQKNGSNIQGANAAAYNINSASLSDAGDYQVVVSNAAGSATSNSAALTVNPDIQPPAITAQPQDLTVTEGQPASFSVSATGTAPLNYQWQKDGSNIQGANAAAYNINSASLSDAGDYQVVVSNAAGSATSNSAALAIELSDDLPAITAQPQDLTVTEGQPASFSVSATGTAPLNYQWQKDGVDIQGANAAAYTIDVTAPADAGVYQVVVSNSSGSVTSNSAVLAVNLPYDTSPVATILDPSAGETFIAGDTIYFVGEGNDNEDGALAEEQLSWSVEIYEGDQIISTVPISSGSSKGSFQVPMDIDFTTNSKIRLYLEVSDTKGLKGMSYVDLLHATESNQKFEPKVEVYPNPFDNEINIKFPEDWPLENVTLFDVDGNSTVLDLSKASINQGFVQVSVESLNLLPGIYLLKLDFTDWRRVVRRLIKVR